MITCLGYQDFPNHAISDTSKGLDKVREDKIWAYEFQYPYITATLGSATIIDIVDIIWSTLDQYVVDIKRNIL